MPASVVRDGRIVGFRSMLLSNSDALNELRTKGPDNAALNPISNAFSRYFVKVEGVMYSMTGICDKDGLKYWPIVTMSHLTSRSIARSAITSSWLSPNPTMKPDFVSIDPWRVFIRPRRVRDLSKFASFLTCLKILGTVSML